LLWYKGKHYYIFKKCVFVTSEKSTRAILSYVAPLDLLFSSTLTNKGQGFQKLNVTDQRTCILIFNINLSKTFLIPRGTGPRYDQICILFFMESTCYSCAVLTIFKFWWQILEKYTNIKFLKNLSTGCPVVPCRQRRTNTMMLIVTFCNI
jgi:hypothetical protein